MTNNVNKIKTELTRSNTTELFRKYRLYGQNDKAAEILIQIFLNDMEKYRHSCISPWQYNHVIQRS